ncbi:MAG: endopeptidase La [Sorangiineae bacterium NIC37A_2]|jgi:ATP-dependent Lon protease|nr:MAG: endopeptidase La [Sorangiineae bacterium NIC37A_2]
MFVKGDAPEGAPLLIPALPLRDIVVFPHMVSQLFVGRDKSIAALDEAMARNKEIFLVAQKNARTNDPSPEDIYEVGTIGAIVQLLRLADGTVKMLVEGRRRAKLKRYAATRGFFLVEAQPLVDTPTSGVEIEALLRSVQATFEVYVKLNKKIQPEVVSGIQNIDDPSKLSDTIAANLPTIKLSDRYELLSNTNVAERLERVYQLMQGEIEILQVEKKIRSRVKKQMERTQKEYYLNEQMQAIQKELGGERDEFRAELAEIEAQLAQKALSAEAKGRVEKELKKLKMMHPTSAEATVVRNYIDWILGLPWGERSEERFDIVEAEKILSAEHFGLEKPKARIIEYLAVQCLTKKLKSPILCFVGPPGVGKTSIARSIAKATGREFVRLSLGGVRDEAEIRGHRRTYIGALPGKLIQSLKKVGKQNPVLLLDEVDKMSSDFRGDPASALLEVLDPEQNHNFNDHYLDLDYDLSEVMFITTANTLSGIPIPLRDRMEIIEISSYTDIEKLAIARKYLVPRNLVECGLGPESVEITDPALDELIHRYTKEAGVRSLDRQLSSLLRKVALDVVKKGGAAEASSEGAEQGSAAPSGPRVLDVEQVRELLGPPRFRPAKADEPDQIGLTHGLSVSDYGGDLLDCEVTVLPGKGKLVVTGLLEKGMEESAQAAVSYIRSRAAVLKLDPTFYETKDIHVHFPEFVRKDGPSAGVTMATSIASALTQIPVRHDIAMTGEITLRGRVMPIGGLKEKLMAALRNGIKTVLVPKDNEKDLVEIPAQVKAGLRIVLVSHMDEVLAEALRTEDSNVNLEPPLNVVEYRELSGEEGGAAEEPVRAPFVPHPGADEAPPQVT